MFSHRRTTHLVPAGIAGLCATIAIAAAMVGAATAAAVSSVDTGAGNFHGERELGLAARPATISSVDAGSGNFRGDRDLTVAASLGGPSPVTEAPQPGQVYFSITTGDGGGPIGDPKPVTSALGPTEAPQPGQTGW